MFSEDHELESLSVIRKAEVGVNNHSGGFHKQVVRK